MGAAKASADLPLCPLWLRSDDPNFSRIRQGCNFNRKLLPACEAGMPSLSQSRNIEGELRTNPRRRECTKEWTIIAYLAMDNNLVEFGEENLQDLAWGKAKDQAHRVDLLVQANFKGKPGKRYIFEADNDGQRVVDAVAKDFRETGMNTGDPKTLREYLAWAVEEFPARHYFLIMGGHGDGWAAQIPREHASAPGADAGRLGHGIAYDETHKDWLTIPDLNRVLDQVSDRFLGQDPLDVYAADACFMQQAEVVFELRKHAKFIYGSVPVMAYQGLPYAAILENFVNGKYAEARNLAMDLPQLMVASYKDKNDRVFASSIDTSLLDSEFAESLNRLGAAGQKWLQDSKQYLVDIFLITGLARSSISPQGSVVELRDFLGKLTDALSAGNSPGGEVADATKNFLAAAQEMQAVVDKVVVSKAAGASYESVGSRIGGLSIWLPSSMPAYNNFQENLMHSNLHRIFCDCSREKTEPNAWGLFLRAVFVPHL